MLDALDIRLHVYEALNILLSALLPSTYTSKNVFRPYITWVLLKDRLVALAKGKKNGQNTHSPNFTLFNCTLQEGNEL